MTKKFGLPILLTLLLLSGGLLYLHYRGNAEQSKSPPDNSGSPTVVTDNKSEKLVFKNYGQAPEFDSAATWLNSDPQSTAALKGKVVLVNFWTYSCIQCIHTIDQLNNWTKQYQTQGLVVIGVHTPEYAFEKVTDNLQTAVNRYHIAYPVVQDNSYSLWNAYNNQFWPATYLIDREGKIVFIHLGDGGTDLIDNAITN